MPRFLRVLALCALPACADKSQDTGETGEPAAPVSYTEAVQPVFDRNCISCHDAAGTYPKAVGLGLVLEADQSYATLVGVPAVQLPGMDRVEPGDAENSYLWHKLNDTHEAAGGSGDEMPPGLILAINDLEPIQLWIEQGANP